MIKILLATGSEDTAIEYYRQTMPHSYMDDMFAGEFKVDIMKGLSSEQLINLTPEFIREYQIVQFRRQVSMKGDTVSIINKFKKEGVKVVLDIDDYWKLPKWHRLWHAYQFHQIEKQTEEALVNADMVTTTTQFFADIIKPYNSNVHVLANCIDSKQPQFQHNPVANSRLRFGWLGGVYHKQDIEPLEKSFNKLWRDKSLKDKWQLVLAGFSLQRDEKGEPVKKGEYLSIEKTFTCDYKFLDTDYVKYLKAFTNMATHCGFDKPYFRHWGKDINTYGELYNSIDVALIPLRDNMFNNCKSELKLIEAGMMKKAAICSDVMPYNSITNPFNFLLVNKDANHYQWYEHIKYLINNRGYVDQLANELHKTISEKFNIDKIQTERKDLYKWLVSE